MAQQGQRVSMAEVAAVAGVSGQTVSRVVHGSPRVDPETRERVERALARLGYRPHRAARALRTGRSQTVGLVVSTLASVGNSRMLQAVADAAAARGYALTVVTLGAEPAGGSAAGGIPAAFGQLRDQGVDGAIVLNEASAIARATALPADLRLVVVDAPAGEGFRTLCTDHAGAAEEATAHLLELGHRTVQHLAGPATSYAAAEREAGWRKALADAGRPAPFVVRGDWSAASGHRIAEHIDATAVFAANDQMALGLLRGLADRGLNVPDDVSVVGFDDVADAADYRPPLTTMRQEFAVLGERAFTALVAEIEGTATGPRDERVAATLVVRASTAPAP